MEQQLERKHNLGEPMERILQQWRRQELEQREHEQSEQRQWEPEQEQWEQ